MDRGEVADRVVDERCVEEARATHELERQVLAARATSKHVWTVDPIVSDVDGHSVRSVGRNSAFFFFLRSAREPLTQVRVVGADDADRAFARSDASGDGRGGGHALGRVRAAEDLVERDENEAR